MTANADLSAVEFDRRRPAHALAAAALAPCSAKASPAPNRRSLLLFIVVSFQKIIFAATCTIRGDDALADDAEGRTVHRTSRRTEIRMIEEIEEFAAKLQLGSLAYAKNS